jgi:starch-binding outer membrane protein SusE/F
MKKIIYLSGIAYMALLFITSCKKEVRVLDTSITPVSSLNSPTDQASIKLDPATGANVEFNWGVAETADGGLIQYEIVFDKADGDFSDPVYRVVSDGMGVQTQATITQKDLNKIASLAGIESSGTGTVKWAVVASKSTNSVISAESRTLQLERPAGFAVVPNTLYIYGSATEAGDDVTKAIPLKRIEEGVFEIYTSLKPGSYLLTDKQEAGGTEYYVDANGIIKLGSTPTEISGEMKPYRLRYDLNVATTEIAKIESLGLYMSAYNTEIGQLDYVGNGRWSAATIPVEFFQFSWGRDERYKFILHTENGMEYLGSQNANNVSPAGQPASYFYLLPVSNSQWDNTYKFDPSADMKNVKVDVFFNSDAPYRHTVTVL